MALNTKGLIRWLREHDHAALLKRPAADLFPGSSALRTPSSSVISVQELLEMPDNAPSYRWAPRPVYPKTALIAALNELAGAAQDELAAHLTRFEVPPEEPPLRALWSTAYPEFKRLCESLPFLGVSSFPDEQLALEARAPSVIYEAQHVGGAEWPLFEGASACEDAARHPRQRLLFKLLSVLCAPSEADDLLRKGLIKELQHPAWSRLLDELVQISARAPTTLDETDDDGRQVGWQLQRKDPDWTLRPVLCQAYKSKAGLRVWKLPRGFGLTDPLDRQAFSLFLAQNNQYAHVENNPGLRNELLDVLVNHPRIILGKGAHIALRRAVLSLVLMPKEDGGVDAEVRLNNEAIDDDALRQIHQNHWESLSFLVQPKAKRALVFQLKNAARLFLLRFMRRGWSFPEEGKEALLGQLDRIGRFMPIELRGSLRGTLLKPDTRPLIIIHPSPDGGLELDAYVRPLTGAPRWRPGVGPATLSLITEGERRYIERDLNAEPNAISERLALLGLKASEGFHWTVLDPHEALALLDEVQRQRADFQVEWTQRAPTISRAATPADLSLTVQKKQRGYQLLGELSVDGERVPLVDLLDAVRKNRRFVPLKSGHWVALSEQLSEQLRQNAQLTEQVGKHLKPSPFAATELVALERSGATLKLPADWTQRTEAITEAQTLTIAVPTELNATLRSYQVEGFIWLARLAHWAPGAILADDMGLGKTLQSLCLLLRRAHAGPALIVAPASVGLNWIRECERFAPSLTPRLYRGAGRKEAICTAKAGELWITSWELMARDIDSLSQVHFSTAVLDEAQAIKNPATKRARASAQVNAGFLLALTGTPVENRVGELWSLFRTVAPGFFSSASSFKSRFVAPIEREDDHAVQAQLGQLIRPFLLRRLKSEVLSDLPKRTDITVQIELSAPEKALYEQLRRATLSSMKAGDGDSRFKLLAALTRLRQLACDPRLVHPDGPLQQSTKIDRLVHLVSDLVASGHSALIFSQFTSLLKLARHALHQKSFDVRYLDGSMSIDRRQTEVDAFQAGRGDAFLISLKAGGTGLNLTRASYVIHLDPWWNPAIEDQATDRAHRIGQKRAVTVYRLVAKGTIEEAVLAMHTQKRALVQGLLEGSNQASALNAEQLGELLALGCV